MPELNPELVDINTILKVVSGWNEKINMSSAELSKMVPFVELFGILENDPANRVSDKRLDEKAIEITLNDYSGSEKVRLVHLFNLIEQQLAVDNNKKLIRTRGVAGIESLQVAVADIQAGAFEVNLSITIPTLEYDIVTNSMLRRLILPGTDWVIMYGWSRENLVTSDFIPIENSSVINLNDFHRGYYRVLKARLISFNWEINKNKIAEAKIKFAASSSVALAITTIRGNKQKFKNLLFSNQAELCTKANDDNASKQLPKEIAIKQKQTIPVSRTKSEKIEQVDGYFYLGWIIEALRQCIETGDQKQFIKRIQYENFTKDKKLKINLNKDSKSENQTIEIKSPAEIPISVKVLNHKLIDTEINNSFSVIISEICKIVNELYYGVISIAYHVAPDGATLIIGEKGEASLKSVNEGNKLTIHVSADNSLLEDISFGGRLPMEIFCGRDLLVDSDLGATTIYNVFQKEAESNKSDEEISYTALQVRKFQNKFKSKEQTLSSSGKAEEWREYLNSSDKNTEKIQNEMLNSEEVPLGLALRNYFLSLQFTIHGTIVPHFMHVDCRGILPGIDGDYEIYETTDDLTPGNFTTTMLCKLVNPYI